MVCKEFSEAPSFTPPFYLLFPLLVLDIQCQRLEPLKKVDGYSPDVSGRTEDQEAMFALAPLSIALLGRH